MKLNNSITINFNNAEIILDELNIAIFDYHSTKVVFVKIHPAARPLLVWRGADYDSIGDYTQEQVESRVLELLGQDLQAGIQNLFNSAYQN